MVHYNRIKPTWLELALLVVLGASSVLSLHYSMEFRSDRESLPWWVPLVVLLLAAGTTVQLMGIYYIVRHLYCYYCDACSVDIACCNRAEAWCARRANHLAAYVLGVEPGALEAPLLDEEPDQELKQGASKC